MDQKLITIPIYAALNKPNLVLGGERELMLFTGLISATMIFVALSFQSAIVGILIWIIFSSLIRMMAKADPLMSKIYIKQLVHQHYYPAHAHSFGC
ncbi:MAG: VirB3 family type IV secretion system protein [Campylobacterales bacterium]|nr:VirB3 family type IV secretion system protein [Campylobacterales bacterium]